MTEISTIERSARVRGLQQENESLKRQLATCQTHAKEAAEHCTRDKIRLKLEISRDNKALQERGDAYRDELMEVEAAGFILRLKWLFTGINK